MKGMTGELRNKFVEPFEIMEKIQQKAYRLSLLENWRIPPVFHLSLLKNWPTASLQQDHPALADDESEVEEPYYEIGKTQRWRTIK